MKGRVGGSENSLETKQPVVVENAPVMRDLFVKETNDVIDLAATIQESILRDLDELYGPKLLSGYKYTFVDRIKNPHKERHEQKIRLALELKAACMKKLTSLADVTRFVQFYQQVKQRHTLIDAEGHKFGAVLAKHEVKFVGMNNDLRKIREDTRKLYSYTHEIIMHLLAQAEELIAARKYAYSVEQDKYHNNEINRIIDILALLFKDRDKTDSSEAIKKEHARKKAEDIRDVIIKDLDACGADELAKIDLLKKYKNYYLNEIYIHDIREDDKTQLMVNKFARSPLQLKRMLLFAMALSELDDEIAVAEKVSFREAKTYLYCNNSSAAAAGAHKNRMLIWLTSCYQQFRGERELTPEELAAYEKKKKQQEEAELENEIRRVKQEVVTGMASSYNRKSTYSSSSVMSISESKYVDFSDPLFNKQFASNLRLVFSTLSPRADSEELLSHLIKQIEAEVHKHCHSLRTKVSDAAKKLPDNLIYNNDFLDAWEGRLRSKMRDFIKHLKMIEETIDVESTEKLSPAEVKVIRDAKCMMAETDTVLVRNSKNFITELDIQKAASTTVPTFLSSRLVLSGSNLSLFARRSSHRHVDLGDDVESKKGNETRDGDGFVFV